MEESGSEDLLSEEIYAFNSEESDEDIVAPQKKPMTKTDRVAEVAKALNFYGRSSKTTPKGKHRHSEGRILFQKSSSGGSSSSKGSSQGGFPAQAQRSDHVVLIPVFVVEPDQRSKLTAQLQLLNLVLGLNPQISITVLLSLEVAVLGLRAVLVEVVPAQTQRNNHTNTVLVVEPGQRTVQMQLLNLVLGLNLRPLPTSITHLLVVLLSLNNMK